MPAWVQKQDTNQRSMDNTGGDTADTRKQNRQTDKERGENKDLNRE